jgi:endonuclease III-like uncharacterized protein
MENEPIGFWNEKKERIKEKYRHITDEDLNFADGKEREMVDMLGHKIGVTAEEMRSIITGL